MVIRRDQHQSQLYLYLHYTDVNKKIRGFPNLFYNTTHLPNVTNHVPKLLYKVETTACSEQGQKGFYQLQFLMQWVFVSRKRFRISFEVSGEVILAWASLRIWRSVSQDVPLNIKVHCIYWCYAC